MNIRNPFRRRRTPSSANKKPIMKVKEMKLSDDGKRLIFIEEPEIIETLVNKEEKEEVTIKAAPKTIDDRTRLYILGYI